MLNKLRSRGLVVVIGCFDIVLRATHVLGVVALGGVTACGRKGLVDRLVVLTSNWAKLADIGVE